MQDDQDTHEDKAEGSLFGGEPNSLWHDETVEPAPVITFTDMDNDGDADIVVTSATEGQSYWIENTLGKELESVYKMGVFRSLVPTVIATGDIDGDGTTDLVIGHLSGAKAFFNDGSWSMQNLCTSLTTPRTILIEDINHDGLADILIRDSQNVVFIPNENGFLGAQSMAWPYLGDSPYMAVGEFDVTNHTMEILTLNGEGVLNIISHNEEKWQPARPISTLSVTSFKIADINNDGIPEVLVEDNAGNKVWLGKDNSGGVTFEAMEEVPAVDLEDAAKTAVTTSQPIDLAKFLINSFMMFSTSNTSASAHAFDDCSYSSAALGAVAMSGELPAIAAPIEPSFDFLALPDMNFDLDPEATIDFSSHTKAAVIDLEYGESYTYTTSNFGGFSWCWFATPKLVETWTNTNTVVNALGSQSGDDIFGNQEDNIIKGGGGNDWIFGEDGNDTIDGGQGQDLIYGGDDDDIILGRQGDDLLYGEDGEDQLFGGRGDDHVYGGNGDDTILGGNGADYIKGGQGDDVICGGAGADTIYGNEGSDTFHYVSASDGGDIIRDFSVSEDSFEFDFGVKNLYTVTEPYTGDLNIEGEGFVWQETGQGSGDLYYDSDMSTAGDETLIAHVTLEDPEETLTVDDISVL